MTNKFRNHLIKRTCKKNYKDYHRYKMFLKKDFQHRCAYCDMNDNWVEPLPYQIDHFIPRTAFESQNRTDLDTDYDNLMYSCPICNRLKSDKYEGIITEKEITNPYFYNPVETDYNDIFFRDEKGRIGSDDKLGREMIEYLQLYRPTKQMAWFLDELKQVYDEIECRMQNEKDEKQFSKLQRVHEQIGNQLYRLRQYFVHSYRVK